MLTVLLWSPVLAVGAPGLSNNQDYASGLGTVAGDVWDNWTRDVPGPLVAVLVAGFAAGLLLHRRAGATRVPPIAGAVPVVLLALAAGRLVQYPRAWLFLLPLVLLTAAAGVAYAVRLAGERRAAWLAPAVALALAAALAVAGLTDPAIRQQNEGRDGPAMTALLGPQLRAHGGHVVAITPFNYILQYDFAQKGLTPDYVVGEVDPGAAAGHVYVVVPGGKTIAQLSGGAAFGRGEGKAFQPVPGLAAALRGTPRLVRSFPTARIYMGN